MMTANKRSGFTIIELLVVMSIIAVLMGFLVSAVQVVRQAGTRHTAQSEILFLTSAAETFKIKMHAPARVTGGGPNDTFRLCTSYVGSNGQPLMEIVGGQPRVWPEADYLLRVFPQVSLTDNGLRDNGAPVSPGAPILLDANQAFVLWTTGGKWNNYRGFSRNPRRPFTPLTAGEDRIGPFFEASPPSRLRDENGVEDGRWRDPWGTPYAVLSVGNDDQYPAIACYGVMPYLRADGTPLRRPVQIISAGRNKKFGPGGVFLPGSGVWAFGLDGGDDLSNFQSPMLSVTP